MDPTATDVRIGLLGPLQVTVDGADRPINGAVRRRLLAVLTLRAGEVLSTDLLSELLWDGAPPATAQSALRVHVSHLRQRLGDPGLIERVGAGYRFALPPEHIDVTGFEQHARSGRQALADGDLEQAEHHLYAAKGLWRGLPLADVVSGAASDIERLFTQRSELSVDLAEWQMRAQGAGADTSDLSALTVERPFDERVWRLLITTQYWNGRQGDALATYQRAVQALDSELGVEPTEALQRLQSQILNHDSALRPPQTADMDLPVYPTTFIGRTGEIETVTALLDQHRLVTLTGLGGVGKTRLGVAVAEAAATGFSHGVVFVSFEALNDPALVPSEVATALGMVAAGADELATMLDQRHLLLVLDNCEQVAGGVAELASVLLSTCPRVRVLATSRVPLSVVGESVWVTPPLDLTADAADPEAALLFLDRAGRHLSQSGLPGVDDPDLREAVTLLGGIPLAIELAAAQCKVLTVADLVDRLRRTMESTAVERDRPQRHHSMQVALTGTLEHLRPAAQMLLGRLVVFRSPVGIEAIEAVCTDAAVPAQDLPELLGDLVQAAIVVADVSRDRGRYWLLPPVRRAAPGVLAGLGHEPADLDARHLDYVASLAQAGAAAVSGPDETTAMGALDDAGADMRAALSHAARSDPGRGLEVAVALTPYWKRRRMHAEGRRWVRQLLEQSAGTDEADRAAALHAGGSLAWDDGDRAEAGELLHQARQIRTRLGDERGLALTLNNLAGLASDQGDHAGAYQMLVRAHELFTASGHEAGAASAEVNRGIAAHKLGRLEDAVAHLEAGRAAFGSLGSAPMEAIVLERLAAIHAELGQHRRAMTLIRSAQTIHDDSGGAEQRARMLWLRALRHRDLGQEADSHEFVRAAAQAVVTDELLDAWWVSSLIETAAALAAPTNPQHAAGLLGAARAHRERSGHGVDSTTVADLEDVVAHLGEVLGPQHLTEEIAIGAVRRVTAVIATIAGIRADASRPQVSVRTAAHPDRRPS